MDRRRTLWLGTIGLFVLHLCVSSRVGGPSVVFDEAGYLGNARWLSGDHNWTMPMSPMYSLGYPALLAPAFRLLHQPDDQWRIVLLVNAVLLASVFPLLVALLRRVLLIPWHPAVIASAVGAVVPATFAASSSAIAENLVLPLVVASVLAAHALVDHAAPTLARIGFGLTVVGLLATHPRFTGAVPLALGLIAAVWLRARNDRIVALANAAVVLAGTVAVQLATRRVEVARWVQVEHLEGDPADWWSLVSSASGRGELAMAALGQAWYVAAGSVGLGILGIAVIVGSLRRRDWAAPQFGSPGSPGRPRPLPAASAIAIAWLLALAGSVLVTSVILFARNQFRVDHYVYGRHNDSFTPIWVAAALAFLVMTRSPGRRLAALAMSGGLVLALGIGVVLVRDPSSFDGAFSPFGAPAVAWAMEARPERGFALATAAALTIVAASAAVTAWEQSTSARRSARSAVVVAVLVAGWFCFDGTTVSDDTATFATLHASRWVAPEAIERLGVDELSIDAAGGRSQASLDYPFYLPEIRFLTYDSSRGQAPPTDFALAPTLDPQRRAAGDRIVVLDQSGLFADIETPQGMAVWVRRGAAQDRLAAEGRLLPADFPAALPIAARKADLEVQGLPAGPVEVPSGGRLPMRVRLRADGEGSPWPDATSYGLPGRVRVGARVVPIGGGGRPAGANSGGELPHWMLPGDEAYFDVGVLAIDRLLDPLPPGRYRVELTLTQEGFAWATGGGDDATFTMDVTPPTGDERTSLGG